MGYWMMAVYDLGWLTEVLKRAHGPLIDHCSSPSENGSFIPSPHFTISPPVGRAAHLPPLPFSRLSPVLGKGLAGAAGNHRSVLVELPTFSEEETGAQVFVFLY